MRLLASLLVASLAITGTSCLDDTQDCTRKIGSLSYIDQDQLTSDIGVIDNYLLDKGITAVKDPTGLRYVIHEAGTGKLPCFESKVVVTYTGKIMNDLETVFDSATEPVKFPLNVLIAGWGIAFVQFREGTSATLYIPSGLAYGPTDRGSIPGNSILIFDVELIAVK